MRHVVVLAALLLPLAAPAAPFEPRSLARFDAGYARCEAMEPRMKGHRDDAYLAVYRVNPDDKALERLAALRRSADYRRAQRAAPQAAAPASGAASSPLAHQCQALWAQVQRVAAPKQ